jgi:D-alanyl-D-alanine dipeptidase
MKKILFSTLSILLFNIFASEQSHLVEVQKVIPNVFLDIKYATKDNFTHEIVYPSARCYLVEPAVKALKAASEALNKKGYRVKIWDGYRPLEVQRIFWKLMPDERYVANPEKGSRHNRGCAVDITLVDKDGKELDMGTLFDDFSERAHRDYKELEPNVVANRKLLEYVMKEHGFEGLPTEWWHFDYKGWKEYPLLDVAIDAVEK